MPDAKKVSLILFDLDGTLIDSARDLHASVNDMLQSLGRTTVPLESVQLWIGNGIDKLIHRSLSGQMNGIISDAAFIEARHEFNLAYDKNNGTYASIYPGVVEALEKLKRQRLPMVCVTNKDRRFTDTLLERTGLQTFFELTVAGDTLEQKKPAPEPLLYAARKFDTEPAESVMVGDSLSDIKAAKSAAFQLYCVSYGYRQGLDFDTLPAALKPDGIVKSLLDLPFVY